MQSFFGSLYPTALVALGLALAVSVDICRIYVSAQLRWRDLSKSMANSFAGYLGILEKASSPWIPTAENSGS